MALLSVLCPLLGLVAIHPLPLPQLEGLQGTQQASGLPAARCGWQGSPPPGEALRLRRVAGDRADPPSGRLFLCQDDSGKKAEESDVLVRKRTYTRKTLESNSKAPPT